MFHTFNLIRRLMKHRVTVGKHNNIAQYYLSYSHVATMALVGFGYLMTFIRRYRFGALSYTFLVTVLVRFQSFFRSSPRPGSLIFDASIYVFVRPIRIPRSTLCFQCRGSEFFLAWARLIFLVMMRLESQMQYCCHIFASRSYSGSWSA